MGFNDDRDYGRIDFGARPEMCQIGRGEQGVLLVEPYTSEVLPLWRFRTPDLARTSSDALYARFEAYLDAGDFPGADLPRKFLQMGWTRARRDANHRSGRKYDPTTGAELAREPDVSKAEAAAISYARDVQAREGPRSVMLRDRHRR